MTGRGELVRLFAKCLKSISLLSLETSDPFVFGFLSKEIEELILNFLRFYSPAKDGDVAQYKRFLISIIRNLWKTLSLLRHFKIISPASSLAAEKDLVSLQLFIISETVELKADSSKKETFKTDLPKPSTKVVPKGISHGGRPNKTKNLLLKYLKEHGQVSRKELFGSFKSVNPKTLRKNLKELHASGGIEMTEETEAKNGLIYSLNQTGTFLGNNSDKKGNNSNQKGNNSGKKGNNSNQKG